MVVYIKELDKNDKLGKIDKFPKVIKNIVLYIFEITNNFFIINISENSVKYIIPNIDKIDVYKKIRKKLEKIKKNTKRKLEIVFSEQMCKYKKELNKYKILDGKKIMQNHIEEIIQNVIGNTPIEMQEIYLLTNNYTQTNVSFIRNIALKVKSTNIITNKIGKYKQLEESLLNNGVIINIANNKRKSLKKAGIIINLDFLGVDIKKYSINRNACIIDISNEQIVDNLKGFEGVVIQDIEPKIDEKEYEILKQHNLVSKFKKIELYESLDIKKDKIDILNLYGRSGKISEKERLIIQKILTNYKI